MRCKFYILGSLERQTLCFFILVVIHSRFSEKVRRKFFKSKMKALSGKLDENDKSLEYRLMISEMFQMPIKNDFFFLGGHYDYR